MGKRDYSYEALAEVTGTDMEVGRGELNAALRDIRKQAEVDDPEILAAEIRVRAKLYRQVFEEAALTPNALAKHWARLPEETRKLKRGGANLHADPPSAFPPSRREQNLAEARKILEMFK